MKKRILLLVVAGVAVPTAFWAHCWQQQAPTRLCQGTPPALLQEQALDHMLQMAVQPVQDYNADIEHKLKEMRALGIPLPNPLVDEGLNPRFRMTPPQLADLQQVFSLRPPAIQNRVDQDQPVACEAHFAVQLSSGQTMGATLAWQMIEQQPHRFEFEPSPELQRTVAQFGIDLNLPLYHLTHHETKVQSHYYLFDPDAGKAAAAEAKAQKGRIYGKYGLSEKAAAFTVPMALQQQVVDD